MASQSQDTVPELCVCVVVYLKDGLIDSVPNIEVWGLLPDSGEFVEVPRDDDGVLEPAVALGCAGTLQEATHQARVYYQRICRIDDVAYSGVPQYVFGHKLEEVQQKSQVDIFSQPEEDSDSL